MAIRIQSDTVGGTGAPETRRAEEDFLSGSSGRAARAAGRGADRVEISALSQVISDASAAHQTRQAERVSQLGRLYRSGAYAPDPAQVSHAMINHALAVSNGEKS